MDVAALLSPAPVANAAGGKPEEGTAPTAGGAFASLFATAMGKAPAGAVTVSPGLVGPTAMSSQAAIAVHASKAASASVVATNAVTPTEATQTAPSAVSATKPRASAKVNTRASERKVDAPPDPPPITHSSEKGAKTKAPTAPVDRPDPISENLKSSDDSEAAVPPQALATAFATAAAPPSGGASSEPARTKVVLSSSVVELAPSSPLAKTVELTPSSPQAKTTAKIVKDDGSDKSSALGASTDEAPLVASTLPVPDAPGDESTVGQANPSVRPALAAAPDLGVVPQVVPTAAPSEAVPMVAASRTIRNAQVAKVATGQREAKPADSPGKPTTEAKATTNDIVLETASAASGDDAPPKDAPKDDAPDPAPEVAAVSNGGTTQTAATERPEAGTNRSSVDRHLVVRQVADRIESLVASRPKDGVVVHLEPRDLGTVTLVVKGLQSALDVKVTASDERVRQSLDSARPELAQALAPRGIELRQLSVSTASSSSTATSSNGGGNANSNPNSEGRARPQTPSPSSTKTTRAETATVRASRSTGRGVDLLV